MNDRTRTFKAKYISKDNKEHHLNVRIYKRLATFGLAIYLIHSGLAAICQSDLETSTTP